MLQTVLVVAAVVIVAAPVAAATRPDSFRVERSIAVKAPPERVFPLIDDFHRWGSWSPWEDKDPNMQRVHSGAQGGTGAVYQWNGNKAVGTGRMEITDSSSPDSIVLTIDFIKPFEAHNTAEFTLQPEGEGTRVNWAVYGPSPFFSKLMGLFVSMDRMIGPDFEAGLQKLKARAET